MRIVAGEARSRIIDAPKGTDTRPTLDRVRENLFNILMPRVPGARVLDLFAGSGALSLEALSRGAASAVMVDCDREAQRVERLNTERLGYQDRVRLLPCDWKRAVRLLTEERAVFDLVFLDPPYAMQDLREVTRLLLPLLSPNARVINEHAAERPSTVCEELVQADRRRWGYAGVTFYRLPSEEERP